MRITAVASNALGIYSNIGLHNTNIEILRGGVAQLVSPEHTGAYRETLASIPSESVIVQQGFHINERVIMSQDLRQLPEGNLMREIFEKSQPSFPAENELSIEERVANEKKRLAGTLESLSTGR